MPSSAKKTTIKVRKTKAKIIWLIRHGQSQGQTAKQNGSWESLDAVENLEIPSDLQSAFNQNKMAFDNYNNFSPSYRKSYLYWLNQAKREETRNIRISEIIKLCEQNVKSRP